MTGGGATSGLMVGATAIGVTAESDMSSVMICWTSSANASRREKSRLIFGRVAFAAELSLAAGAVTAGGLMSTAFATFTDTSSVTLLTPVMPSAAFNTNRF